MRGEKRGREMKEGGESKEGVKMITVSKKLDR
jgi:hypothetical protein